MRAGASESAARRIVGGSNGVCSANAPAQLAGVLCGVMESSVAAIVICCYNSALHRSKQGMQLAARAQHGVVLSRRRVGWCMCARPPPTADVAPGGVVVCVPTGGRVSIVRKSRNCPCARVRADETGSYILHALVTHTIHSFLNGHTLRLVHSEKLRERIGCGCGCIVELLECVRRSAVEILIARRITDVVYPKV